MSSRGKPGSGSRHCLTKIKTKKKGEQSVSISPSLSSPARCQKLNPIPKPRGRRGCERRPRQSGDRARPRPQSLQKSGKSPNVTSHPPSASSASRNLSISTGLFPLVERPLACNSARSSVTFSLLGSRMSLMASRGCGRVSLRFKIRVGSELFRRDFLRNRHGRARNMASVGQGGVGFECRAPIGWLARLGGAWRADRGSHWSVAGGGLEARF